LTHQTRRQKFFPKNASKTFILTHFFTSAPLSPQEMGVRTIVALEMRQSDDARGCVFASARERNWRRKKIQERALPLTLLRFQQVEPNQSLRYRPAGRLLFVQICDFEKK